MIRIRDHKILLRRISLVICFILLIGFVNIKLNGANGVTKTEPSFEVTIDPLTPNPAQIGEDITVTGTIKPQDFEATRQKKQIVLVLDLSGSMQGEKIRNLRTAASSFIKTMSGIPNMEIAIVGFSSEATINPTLKTLTYPRNSYNYATRYTDTIYQNNRHLVPDYISLGSTFMTLNTTTESNIEGMINNLQALGGTNTGEGLRKAEYMLENGDSSAKKSIVFMSDGLPTFYSVNTDTNHSYYTTINNTNPSYAGTGNDTNADSVSKSKEYATKIGNIIKTQNVNVFSIGYGLGDKTSTGNITMQDIHKSMGGDTSTEAGTFFASGTDSNAITGVFNKIADKIIAEYTLTDMKINLNLNSKFTLNIGGNEVNIRNVIYKTTNLITDEHIIYKADPIPFTFTFKGNVEGDYTDVFNGSNITALWNGEEKILTDNFPEVAIKVINNTFPTINGSIVGQSPDPATKLQDITLKCKVNPEGFKINSTIFDKSGPKDIVFVVDTSSSMSDKLTSVKNGLYGKIANNTDIENTQYGIVTFNSSINDEYISGGLTSDVNTLDSAIKNIQCSDKSTRNIGDAMESAKTILDDGRSDSAKYLILIASDTVTYTEEQLVDIQSSNFKAITVNLGYITPPTKVNNAIVAGNDEPNNNIKDLHYNLIGKSDDGDNILEKVDNSYFININYDKVTNTSNPNEFFTLESNMNQVNIINDIHNYILPLVAEKIENGVVQIKTPSYTFKTKLKFKTEGKFDIVSGLSTSSDTNYDVETDEFDVTYNLEDGEYVPATVADISFTIKIKSNTDIKDLKFGPGIVSYTNLGNKLTSTIIDPYILKISAPIQILKHGLYKGVISSEPSIIDGTNTTFNLTKGSNANFGATMSGSISNDTGVKLEIPKEFKINNTINVYTYDDNGKLTPIGTMVKSTTDDTNTTYLYQGETVVEKKILLLYSEELLQGTNRTEDYNYTNSLSVSDDKKDVKIKLTGELPELF